MDVEIGIRNDWKYFNTWQGCKTEQCLYVIHVDSHNSLIYEFLEDVIHHCLKGHGTVHEAKEHDQGFKQALVNLEGGFPLLLS